MNGTQQSLRSGSGSFRPDLPSRTRRPWADPHAGRSPARSTFFPLMTEFSSNVIRRLRRWSTPMMIPRNVLSAGALVAVLTVAASAVGSARSLAEPCQDTKDDVSVKWYAQAPIGPDQLQAGLESIYEACGGEGSVPLSSDGLPIIELSPRAKALLSAFVLADITGRCPGNHGACMHGLLEGSC